MPGIHALSRSARVQFTIKIHTYTSLVVIAILRSCSASGRDPLDVALEALAAVAPTPLAAGLEVVTVNIEIGTVTTIGESIADLDRPAPQLVLEHTQLHTEAVVAHHLSERLKKEHKRRST